jgi:outer membrane lipoprotein-sorting protein
VDVLANAFRGLAGVKTFRAKLVMSGLPKVGTQEMNLDVVLPDRFHVTSQQLEMILVGKTVYMKVANKWQKVATTQFDLSLADPGKLEKDLQSATGTKVMGTDDLNGTPAFVYQFTTSVKGPPAQTHTYKVWIGAKDGLPRQMEVDVNTGAKTTISFFDYNTPITINAPI